MKIGLVGFSGSGKSTVFRWLTGVAPDPARVQQGQTGMAKLPDPRVDKMAGIFKPKKTTYAEIAFLDTPGLDISERRDNPRRLGILRESDGLVVVLNGYAAGDLAADLRQFREEIAFADLEILTNRVSKLEANMKKPKPAKEREVDEHEHGVLKRLIVALEAGDSPRTLGLRPEDEKAVRSFQLLTLKPEIVFVNQGEAGPPPAALPDALAAPAKLELELEDLSPEDREAFAADLGLTGSQRDDILRRIFAAMGDDRVPDRRRGRVPGVAAAGRVGRRRRCRPDSHRSGEAVRAGRGGRLRRIRPGRLDEGGEGPGRLSAGGEDVRRPGR